MLFYIKLFFRLVRLNMKSQMEYRANFVVAIIVVVLLNFGFLWFIEAVLDKFHLLKGWAFGDIAFLMGLRLLSHGTFYLLMSEIEFGMNFYILSGDFDKFLLKPVNPLFLYANGRINLIGAAQIPTGIAFLWISTTTLRLDWTFVDILMLLIVVLGAILIEFSMFLITSSFSFWVLKTQAFHDIMFQLHEQYILYPISIYGKPIQFILTFFIPFAFINFYPAAHFLGKSSDLMFHPYFAFLTPIVGIISFLIAYNLWKLGIRSYQSTGS